MASKMTPKCYWDACLFIAIAKDEPGRADNCVSIWREAAIKRNLIILTSAISIAECADAAGGEERDQTLQGFFENQALTVVNADRLICERARGLQRSVFADTGKKLPVRDSIHVATALQVDATIMYTFDADDLLSLSGKFTNRSGLSLNITEPRAAPKSPTLL